MCDNRLFCKPIVFELGDQCFLATIPVHQDENIGHIVGVFQLFQVLAGTVICKKSAVRVEKAD